jgi:hypothetical protein
MSEMTNPDGSRNMERDRDFAKKHAGHWCCQGGWGEMAAIAFYWLAECEKLRGERDRYKQLACDARDAINRAVIGKNSDAIMKWHGSTMEAVEHALAELAHARAALKKCGEAHETTVGRMRRALGEALGWVLELRPRAGDSKEWKHLSDEMFCDLDAAADTPRGADEMTCPECGPVTKHDEDGCCLMCGIDLFHDDDGNLTIQTPEVYKAHGFSIPEDTEEPEPPEHLKPYLATSPPTLSAAEQEHADKLAVEIGRDQKGETR